jgi:hypothetical protein
MESKGTRRTAKDSEMEESKGGQRQWTEMN